MLDPSSHHRATRKPRVLQNVVHCRDVRRVNRTFAQWCEPYQLAYSFGVEPPEALLYLRVKDHSHAAQSGHTVALAEAFVVRSFGQQM